MGNGMSNYKIIDVTPTLRTDEYAQHDILFNVTEIPNAVLGDGGCAELINITVNSDKAGWKALDIVIFENNQSLDAAGDGISISSADGKAAGMLGWIQLGSDGSLDLGNFTFANAVPAVAETQLPFLIKAADSSTSCYFVAILRGTAETFGADDLTFRFHIKQR